MFKAIIWDFDGTLFNTYPGMVEAFQRALKEYAVEESDEIVFLKMKISVSHAVQYVKNKYHLTDEFAEKFASYEKQLNAEVMGPYPHAREVCRWFKEKDGINYIFTHRGNTTLKYLKHHGMLDYFDEIMTKHYGYKKPDADGFLYFIDKYKLSKNQVMVVGDRDIDILGAQNAGIASCLYNVDEIQYTSAPDYIIKSLDELYDIVEK